MSSYRAPRWIAVAVAIAASLALGWWAGRATLVEAGSDESAAPQRVEATVSEATVGRSVTYNATVTQSFTPVASNVLAGTVTHVGDDAVDVGDEIYAVDGLAVRVVEGATPFWRDLKYGAIGPDVLQLERALAALDFLDEKPDDTYDGGTYRAVWAWQKATGHVLTGMVAHGEVAAVPTLPTTVKLEDAVGTGLVLAGGEPVVLARQETPLFALVLMQDQAAQVPPDAEVTVAFEKRTWPALVTGTTIDDDGSYHLALAAPDGGPVCGKECGLLPAQETVSLMADIALVPSATGPGVPAAAVHTDDAGATYVNLPDGTREPVTVVAAGDGIAVIDGLDVGDVVLVLDTATAKAPTVPSAAADDGE